MENKGKAAKVRKDVRMSPELAEWIESLPARYGDTFSEKARAALEIAREYAEKEDRLLHQAEPNPMYGDKAE